MREKNRFRAANRRKRQSLPSERKRRELLLRLGPRDRGRRKSSREREPIYINSYGIDREERTRLSSITRGKAGRKTILVS